MEQQQNPPVELDDEGKQAIKEVFKKFDKDNSGTIDYNEVKSLAKELGEDINADEVNKIFQDLDENQDGKISFDEFWVWWNSGRSNKLEKLVYFKLKSMKLLKQAHADFVRMGGSLESKYDKTRDNHYVAINYGESPGQFRVNVLYSSQDDEIPTLIKEAQKGLKDAEENAQSFRVIGRLKVKDSDQALAQISAIETAFKAVVKATEDKQFLQFYEGLKIKLQKNGPTEVVVTALIDLKTHAENISGPESEIFLNFNEQSEAHFEAILGLRYSLNHLMDNSNMKFIKWLLSGFLVEGKLTMSRGALGFFRQALQQQLKQTEDDWSKNAIKKQLRQVAIASLLCGSKFHLVFQDINDIDSFFAGLGLSEITEDQPTVQDLLDEIANNFEFYTIRDAPPPENVQNDPPIDLLWKLIQFFMDFGEGEASVQVFHPKAFVEVQVLANGLARVVNHLFTKPPQSNNDDDY